jgi:conjugal transfer mating pair stabilization protein TraG
MAYEIYTFGNGEILKGVFDAIAMCLNSHTESLFEPLKKLGLIIGVFWAALYAIYKDQITVFTNWIIPMTLDL